MYVCVCEIWFRAWSTGHVNPIKSVKKKKKCIFFQIDSVYLLTDPHKRIPSFCFVRLLFAVAAVSVFPTHVCLASFETMCTSWTQNIKQQINHVESFICRSIDERSDNARRVAIVAIAGMENHLHTSHIQLADRWHVQFCISSYWLIILESIIHIPFCWPQSMELRFSPYIHIFWPIFLCFFCFFFCRATNRLWRRNAGHASIIAWTNWKHWS